MPRRPAWTIVGSPVAGGALSSDRTTVPSAQRGSYRVLASRLIGGERAALPQGRILPPTGCSHGIDEWIFALHIFRNIDINRTASRGGIGGDGERNLLACKTMIPLRNPSLHPVARRGANHFTGD